MPFAPRERRVRGVKGWEGQAACAPGWARAAAGRRARDDARGVYVVTQHGTSNAAGACGGGCKQRRAATGRAAAAPHAPARPRAGPAGAGARRRDGAGAQQPAYGAAAGQPQPATSCKASREGIDVTSAQRRGSRRPVRALQPRQAARRRRQAHVHPAWRAGTRGASAVACRVHKQCRGRRACAARGCRTRARGASSPAPRPRPACSARAGARA